MKTYILNEGAGTHFQNGIRYTAGDAVNTEHNLTKQFPHKFKEAPAGVQGTKWPLDCSDCAKKGSAYIIQTTPNANTYKIVGADGKVIEGCSNMRLSDAIKAFRKLFGTKAEEVKKAEPKVEKPAPTPEPEEEEEEEEAEEDTEEEEEDTEEEEEEEEEEEAPKPKSKKMKIMSKKSKDKGKRNK